MSFHQISPEKWLQDAKNSADWVGLRFVRENTAYRSVRNDKPERNLSFLDQGVMVEVLVDGHFGYAGTADLSPEGMKRALATAIETTKAAAAKKAFPFTIAQRPKAVGRFESPRQNSLDQASLQEITSVLLRGCQAMKQSDFIVNRSALAMIVETDIEFYSSNGSDARQSFNIVILDLNSTAAQGSETQTRSLNGGYARAFQKGAEAFDRTMFEREGERLGREAAELLTAPNCPSGPLDLILMPDQMMLQIHESIGHPLEIDRILGDERNYAGWSFVQSQDFGKLQYGSKLMNVSFDPTRAGEIASYAFDDGGTPATKEFLIKDGVLQRGLGSLESQVRSKLPGVANFRSASWNRAPIDRMANINLEPGTTSMESMISSVENGVLMHSNRSWSIDDYRNKFQFGCEYGQLIKNGKLAGTVKNPNYRGTTVDFWNRLKAVGAASTVETYGTPYCGKGEPNQIIRVGHAAPPCLFSGVEVFGGHS